MILCLHHQYGVGKACLWGSSFTLIGTLCNQLFFVYLKVLDEIHGQPVSLALSMVSLPAPESVVDSFPLKNHEKTANGGDEIEQ